MEKLKLISQAIRIVSLQMCININEASNRGEIVSPKSLETSSVERTYLINQNSIMKFNFLEAHRVLPLQLTAKALLQSAFVSSGMRDLFILKPFNRPFN